MTIQAGVFLPHIGLADPALLRDFGQKAEQLGIHSVWAGDHIVLPLERASGYPYSSDGRFYSSALTPYTEQWTTLTWVAAATTELRLGSAVCILPYRHPALIAKVVATLDRLSGGRTEFGVGAGWLAEEFAALGVRFEARASIMDEQLALIRRLWTEETVTFTGQHYQVQGMGFAPKPVQDPHPRMWVGGNSKAARERAVRVRGVWFPALHGQSIEQVATWRGELRQACIRAGLPPDAVPMAGVMALDLREQPDNSQVRHRQAMTGGLDTIADSIRQYLGAGLDYPVFMMPATTAPEVMVTLDKLSQVLIAL